LALIAAVVGAVVGWLLVRAEARAWIEYGFDSGPEMGFVVFLSVGAAVATFYISRRILDGPGLSRTGWSLSFEGQPPATIGGLLDALKSHGYRLEAAELDDAAEPKGAAPPSRLLAGAQIALADPQRKAGRARVVLRLSSPAAPQEPGLGLIESEDTPDGFYDELAQYVIAKLGELVPGISYKGANSTIDAEPAESLGKLLPPHPSRLDGSRRSLT
jgi:hypothetical protein